jgi:predicted small metal-binding protein
MYEFQCGSPVCSSKFAAHTKEELMAEVSAHVKKVHKIPVPTQSILSYLEKTAVTDRAGS